MITSSQINGSDEKTFFSSEPAKAVLPSGSGGCQTSKRNKHIIINIQHIK